MKSLQPAFANLKHLVADTVLKAGLLGIAALAFFLGQSCRILAGPATQAVEQPPAKDTTEPKTQDGTDERKSYTRPITVSGRALDEYGRAVSDARIYLISVQVDYRRLAETVSDATGRYEFRDVALPIEPAQPNSSRQDVGGFELLGIKADKAFAWRPKKWYLQVKNEEDELKGEIPFADLPDRFFEGEQIELDLKFGEPFPIQGRIVDDLDQPLAGVQIALRNCGMLEDDYNIKNGFSPQRELSAVRQRETIPDEIRLRTTDSDGRFEFGEMPAECQFEFRTSLAGYAPITFHAATTDRELPLQNG